MVEVAIGILISNDEVWVQQRRATGHLDGLLEFPGGKIKSGETPVQAVRREFLEEVGLKLKESEIHSFRTIDYDYPDRSLRLHFFLIPLLHKAHVRLAMGSWISPVALKDRAIPPANKAILDILIQMRGIMPKQEEREED